MESKYRTPKDVFKDIAKSYEQLGKYLWELQRMFNKSERRSKKP